MHPKKSVLATASDDTTWKLWSIPDGKLLMGGEGHSDWLAGIDFHPKGGLLEHVLLMELPKFGTFHGMGNAQQHSKTTLKLSGT